MHVSVLPGLLGQSAISAFIPLLGSSGVVGTEALVGAFGHRGHKCFVNDTPVEPREEAELAVHNERAVIVALRARYASWLDSLQTRVIRVR